MLEQRDRSRAPRQKHHARRVRGVRTESHRECAAGIRGARRKNLCGGDASQAADRGHVGVAARRRVDVAERQGAPAKDCKRGEEEEEEAEKAALVMSCREIFYS